MIKNILFFVFSVFIITIKGNSQVFHDQYNINHCLIDSIKFQSGQTANIHTDFQGSRFLRTCSAELINDTTVILIQQETASTYDKIVIKIVDQYFNSYFKTRYFVFETIGKTKWEVKKQKLVLDNNDFKSDKEIGGYIDLIFSEFYMSEKKKIKTKEITFKGPFRTKIR